MTKSKEKLKHKDKSYESVKKLTRIDNIAIDQSIPADERMLKYLKDIKNPYCFLCGDTVVNICFSDTENGIDFHLLNFFKGLKSY